MNKFILYFFLISFSSPTVLKSENKNLIKDTKAYALKDETWQKFRDKFPYHIQTIGVLPQLSDGSTIIIISEPPPHTDSVGFTKFFPKLNSYFEIKKQPIGVDGWVKDIVIVSKGLLPQELDKTISQLSRYMYFTAYKANYIDLSNLDKYNTENQEKLNYDISALELRDWFITKDETFYPINNKKEGFTIQEIFRGHLLGVFTNPKNSFTVWVIPKNESLYAFKPEIHQFTLESDLVLGAISNPEVVAIIGKTRTTSLLAMPPLRTESVLNLAASNKSYLYQSYERFNPFAGKLANNKDWAPIVLSPELQNSELGSVLNITDQMLKSWSEHGEIKYEGFEKFPKPKVLFPSIHKSVTSNSITYNWNTKGFILPLKVQTGKLEFVTMDRTGCLPLSYLPNGKKETSKVINNFEGKGRDYFSELNNAELSRVVSYTFLYQIFKMYGIVAEKKNNSSIQEKNNPIIEKTHSLISKLRTSQLQTTSYGSKSTQEMALLNRQRDTAILTMRRFPEMKSEYETSIKEIEENLKIYESNLLSFKSYLSPVKTELGILERFGEPGFALLDTLLNLKDYPYSQNNVISKVAFDKISESANKLLDSFQLSELTYRVITETPEEVSNNLIHYYKNNQEKWIKTPSIVISWSEDSATMVNGVGGHSLDVSNLKFGLNADLPTGTIAFTEDGSIVLNEKDYSKLSSDVTKKIEEFRSEIFQKNVSNAEKFNQLKDYTQNLLVESKTAQKPIREAQNVFPLATKVDELTPMQPMISDVIGNKVENKIGNFSVLNVEKTELNSCETIIDDIINYLGKTEDGDAQIRFKNVTQEEASVIMKSVKIKTTREVTGVIVKNEKFDKLFTDVFDFSKLNIESIKVFDGEFGKDIFINLPKKSASSISSRLTVKGIADKFIGKVKEIFKNLFERAKVKNFDFRKALEVEFKNAGIEYKSIDIQLEDCIICENNKCRIMNSDYCFEKK